MEQSKTRLSGNERQSQNRASTSWCLPAHSATHQGGKSSTGGEGGGASAEGPAFAFSSLRFSVAGGGGDAGDDELGPAAEAAATAPARAATGAGPEAAAAGCWVLLGAGSTLASACGDEDMVRPL